MCLCWLELTVLLARAEKKIDSFYCTHLSQIIPCTNGREEVVNLQSVCILIQQQGSMETQQAWEMSGCHREDSDTLLRSVSAKLQRQGKANLIFLCAHTVGCATCTFRLGGESQSIARQMQYILPPIGRGELLVAL